MKIYMDNAATTSTYPEVLEAMKPFYIKDFYNPSAIYSDSVRVREAIEDARLRIASLIGAEKDEIYFTSGGTESDNWACEQAFSRRGHIITSAIEHKAVLNPVYEYVKNQGRADIVNVDSSGFVNPYDIMQRVRRNTVLISIMMANNEIGVIEPIEEIGHIAKEYDVIFHTDAVQAFAHIPIDVKKLNIDMLSASAHKFNGPKGVGFLYAKNNSKIRPLIFGGGQEKGMRSGTENVPGIIGMAMAAEMSVKRMEYFSRQNRDIFKYIVSRITKEVDNAILNGSPDKRLPNNISLSFRDIDASSLLVLLDVDGICASAGSACNTSKKAPSHVLKAIGLDENYIHGTIRMTLGNELTRNQAMYVTDRIIHHVRTLRES